MEKIIRIIINGENYKNTHHPQKMQSIFNPFDCEPRMLNLCYVSISNGKRGRGSGF